MQVETQTNPSSQNIPPVPPEQGNDLTPLNLIRTETVLSKFPRHILAKSGQRPEIRIEKLTTSGKLEMRWYVSYNELYGPARQLAYDLDTLIIDRAIEETFEEARRSAQELPRLIPIGSLRDICRKLNFEENGSNTAKIKKALQQNAGTVINAILSYRGNDGSEQTIDGTFTCYGVFFIGKKLPDGRKADQTYVSTTNEYHQVISTSPTRPLDYDYKAQLPPTPRRWYELASFAMYGALKNNQPSAKILYSDYCDRAPHVRYPTFDQVKKQMYKVHRPHLLSGYITKVSYDQQRDEQGRLDWMMHYVPGPKARSDYAAITGKKIRQPASDQLGAGETRHRPRQRHLNLKPLPEISAAVAPARPPVAPELDPQLVSALTSRGVSDTPAVRKLLAELPSNYPVFDSLEWADFQIAQQPGKWHTPAGFYISLLRDRTTPPPTFETSWQRKARKDAEFAKQQAFLKAEEEAEWQKETERQQADQVFSSLSPQEQADLESQVKAELKARHPKIKWDAAGALHEGTIRAGIRRLLLQRSVHAMPEHEQGSATTAHTAFAAKLQAVLTTPQLTTPGERVTVPPQAQTGSPSVETEAHAPQRTTTQPVD